MVVEGDLVIRTEYGHARLFFYDSAVELSDMLVSEDARRKGHGKAILEICLHIARAVGVQKMTLHVDLFNDAAIGLYRNRGFTVKENEHHMELKL